CSDAPCPDQVQSRQGGSLPVSPTEQAFLDDIRDNIDDDTPRLVYADWLDDHGQSDRAEFIRRQCQFAQLHEDDPCREAVGEEIGALLKGHEETWLAPLRAGLDSHSVVRLKRAVFQRGLIEELHLGIDRGGLLQYAAPMLRCLPLRSLYLKAHSPQLAVSAV